MSGTSEWRESGPGRPAEWRIFVATTLCSYKDGKRKTLHSKMKIIFEVSVYKASSTESTRKKISQKRLTTTEKTLGINNPRSKKIKRGGYTTTTK